MAGMDEKHGKKLGRRGMITVNGGEFPWRPGMTIQDVLDGSGFTFRMLGVWVDGVPYRREHFPSTPVPDGAEVEVLHMITGG